MVAAVRKPTVVITGASAGVGRAVACAFAKEGWRVALVARGVARLEATAQEVRRLGGEPLVLPADVADAQATDNVA
ncbi:MAG TPA: SDR family NAD(P)-dependent oxidoreductase, partial [Pseudorhizobium sp.]|nr:SDR family NAD(P)-dependent oxidoreductase [Pseudorhizobium sp.]